MAVHLIQIAKKLAHDAGQIARKMRKKELKIERKGHSTSLVTNADKEVEEFLITTLKKMFPDDSILSEESGLLSGTSDYKWIIDPIDGTTNFAHGLPFYSVSLALIEKGQPYLGVIDLPDIGETFWAQRGKGAFLGNQRIHVSQRAQLGEALLVTGYPYTREGAMYQTQHAMIQKIHHKVRDLRRTGSAAMDLAYTAAGRFDAFWEFGLEAWDIAAGMLIVEEAGGKVTNTDGTRLDPKQRAILASNGVLHEPLLAMLKQK